MRKSEIDVWSGRKSAIKDAGSRVVPQAQSVSAPGYHHPTASVPEIRQPRSDAPTPISSAWQPKPPSPPQSPNNRFVPQVERQALNQQQHRASHADPVGIKLYPSKV